MQEYLLDPHKIGVCCSTIEIPASKIKKLLEEAVRYDKEDNKIGQEYKTIKFQNVDGPFGEYGFLLEDFEKVIDHLDIYSPRQGPLGPWKLKKPSRKILTEEDFNWTHSFLGSEYMISRFPSPSKFLSEFQVLLDRQNAVSLKRRIVKDNVKMSIYSLNEDGIDSYKDFLSSIPIIGNDIKVSPVIKKFSSRYCYSIYPSALIAWVYNVADNPIPIDILEYLLASVRYFQQKEWRISIILSAISVETLLAELVEEASHKQAPADTLGSLLNEVLKTTNVPPDIRSHVWEVNDNRILAVHRSFVQLAEREARTSLVGATKFVHWLYMLKDLFPNHEEKKSAPEN